MIVKLFQYIQRGCSLAINLGARLREVRLAKGLTLEEVAAGTGLSVSFLSMVERNKVSISVDNLEKLAEFYQVHLVQFFAPEPENSLTITRKEEILDKLSLTDPTPTVIAPLTSYPGARMEPLLVYVAPGKEEPHFRAHDADVLLYVIQGQARLIAENGKEADLRSGDLAYYVNVPRRRLANASQGTPLLVLLISAPPTSTLETLRRSSRGFVMP